MTAETVLTNAVLVMPQETMPGTLKLHGGRIVAIDAGRSILASAIDLDGDLLVPGAVDLHSDNLERQVHPRSSARWPSREAMIAHDARCAAAGVTTVLDALCVGDLGYEQDRTAPSRKGSPISTRSRAPACCASSIFSSPLRNPCPRHARFARTCSGHARADGKPDGSQPGRGAERRPRPLSRAAPARRRGRRHDRAPHRRDARPPRRLRDPNRRALLDRLRRVGVALASHDDRTEAEVEENHRDGIAISEFPVTIAAARAARARGMAVIAGAPNLVRGGSHSGNVAVVDLLRAGLVDALASDYVPGSLISAAFRAAALGLLSLPQAVALVSLHPARLAGLAGPRCDRAWSRRRSGAAARP